MTDYVVVLTEKYDLLHLQLLDARQLIDKNHIVIERDKVDKGPPKCRSVSLVCPPTSTPEERRISLVKQDDKGRQGEDVELVGGARILSQGAAEESPQVSNSPASGPPVRKRTKKCSMFETIEENQDCPPSALITSPRKSSKKVSIAENLNCDYSDCEYSEVGETGGDGSLEEEDGGDKGSSSARSLTTFFLELLVTIIFVLVSYTISYPKQAAVIFLSFLIIYLILMIIS